MARTVEIVIKAVDKASKVIKGIDDSMGGLARSGFGALNRSGQVLLSGAALGLGGLATGFGIAAGAGLSFNSQMENVQAQLFAFLKDGDAVADTLDMIEKRAAKTPFAFGDMATAVTSLIPAAKQSGKDIEELIGIAEILAASNPGQGLEGAAFSLREALSGDFVSIIERFNLPRQRLNELKDQGVPALEAISIAMAELGLDADLVTNLSQTATGRLSTVKDNLLGIASDLTQPIFTVFSESMGGVIPLLEELRPIAENAGLAFGKFIEALRGGATLTQALNGLLMRLGVSLEIRQKVADLTTELTNLVNQGLEWFNTNLKPLITDFVTWKDVLIGLGIVVGVALVPLLVTLATTIGSILLPVIAVIGVVALLRNAWEQNWFGIQEKTQAVVDWFTTNIPLFLQNIQTWWATWGPPIVQTASRIWDWIKKRVQIFINTVKTIINLFLAAINGDWFTFGEELRTLVDTLWTDIKTAFDNVWPEIVEIAQGIATGVYDAFFDIEWGQLGTDIINGIADGIKGAIDTVKKAATDAAQAAKDAFAGFMQSKSPAKTMIPQGFNVGWGVAEGIKASYPMISDAAGGMGSTAYSSTQINNYTINTGRFDAGRELRPMPSFNGGI